MAPREILQPAALWLVSLRENDIFVETVFSAKRFSRLKSKNQSTMARPMCNSLNRSTRSLPASSEAFSFSKTMAGCIFLALATSLCFYIPASQEFSTYPGKRNKKKKSVRRGLWKTLYREDVESMGAPTDSESTSDATSDNSKMEAASPEDVDPMLPLKPNKQLKVQFLRRCNLYSRQDLMFFKANWKFGTTSQKTTLDVILGKNYARKTGSFTFNDTIWTRNFLFRGMAVFCTWYKATNDIEVLVSVPENFQDKLALREILEAEPFKPKTVYAYKFIQYECKFPYRAEERGFYHFDQSFNFGLIKNYTVAEKPDYLKFTEEKPLDTWLRLENQNNDTYYCISGSTVFCFQEFKKQARQSDEPIRIYVNVSRPGPFLQILQMKDQRKYEEVIRQLRKARDSSEIRPYDVAHQSVMYNIWNSQGLESKSKTTLPISQNAGAEAQYTYFAL
eukprot:GHVP01038914.1.p1 GENE.GHVP01038914.1~~GHVP01038914.1.p1  ORF type:complete len:449 (-),score=39.24 GHVP01038914.1:45-1391(-)